MKKRILFLCTGNSARSQMAEGLLGHLAGDRFEVFSAGTNPSELNPLAIKVMDEIGIDISGQKSKSIEIFLGKSFDYVITLCDDAKGTCPAFSGKHENIYWGLPDPTLVEGEEEEKLATFRRIRNQLKEHILKFLNIPKDSANLKCPYCGYIQVVPISQSTCLHFSRCAQCQRNFAPLEGSCCVICSYSDKTCPVFLA